MAVARPARRAGAPEALELRRHQEERAIDDREVELLAAPAAPGDLQRRHQVERSGEAGEAVREGGSREPRRLREPEHARLRQVVEVVADPLAGGALLPVARERGVDEGLVILAQTCVVDAEPRRDAGTEALEDGGRRARELSEGSASGIRLEIERDGVGPGRERAGGKAGREPGVLRLAAARQALDPHHLGPEIAQQRQAVETRQGVADGEDDRARERRVRSAQAGSLR